MEDRERFGLASDRLGCLPVLDHFLGRIGLDERLRRYVPADDARLRLAPGVAVGVVMRNIVVRHRPLYALGEWAAPYDPEFLGLSSADVASLNDDRVGRALDRLFDADRASLLTETVLDAVNAFGIDCSELHNDSTTVTVTGPAYDEAGPPMRGGVKTPDVTFGHNKENLARHRIEHETSPRRRPLSRAECQALFDAADARVEAVQRSGRKGTVAALRDATMLKVAYAFGLRRRELLMLEVDDLAPNPKAPEFGNYGVLQVRYAKGTAGSGPRRRGVLTVMDWSVEVLAEWIEHYWPLLVTPGTRWLWPSERNPRVSEDRFNAAFARLAATAGLPAGLSPHCLRHSYITHLVEDGYDALFVQQQAGHEHASTTSIYTAVSSDYKTRMLRAALDKTLERNARTRKDRR